MRSAVSVILSGTTPEQNMSWPDYQQIPHDHQALLVVVRHIGRQLRTKQFNRAFDRISRICSIKIQDSQNVTRSIWIRYLRSYPAENNDWGDFQTHRKALGLISIGQCNSQEELNELCRIHESLKVKYTWTLFDSRCILFGLNSDGSIYEESHSSEESPCTDLPSDVSTSKSLRTRKLSSESRSSPSTSITSDIQRGSQSSDTLHSLGSPPEDESELNDTTSEESSSRSESVTGAASLPPSESLGNETPTNTNSTRTLVTPTNFKSRTLFYPTMDLSQGLENDIEEFVSALFWVLEKKRLDKLGLRKADRTLLVQTLCAPFEKKDFVGLDLESKNNKRRAEGRLKKQLGDLSLQAGLQSEAITHYAAAIEILKSVNDWLWLGSALEGLCSASVTIMYPHLRRSQTQTLQRNSSLQGMELMKVKNFNINSSSLGLDTAGVAKEKSGACKNCLNELELLEKYREAVTHYGKYRQAGVIETEASIKAALVLMEQRQTLHAADFLQNAVFISLQLTEEEKMQRFNALSELYTRLGFHRKAAFFKRVAAMRCVSPTNPNPNWALCHSLLLELMDGYNLSLDSNEPLRFGFFGWPRLQIQVLQELVGTAKKKGNNALATRHMTLLLHSMLPHLTVDEKREFSMQLEILSKESEGFPVPLALENGSIVPPVHLTTIPFVRVFKLVAPTPHMKPEKIEERTEPEEISPFVYTPFLKNRDKVIKDNTKAEFKWVEGELCEVTLLLENPLPVELKLNSICLITEGVNFQINSNVISIPADSTMFPATLTGIPLSPGTLRILGYSTYTLGVKSNIKLKNMPYIKIPYIDVDIVPALPCLEVETSQPRSEFFSSISDSIVNSASISLYMGQSQECSITLRNTGKVPIETIEISLESKANKKINEVLSWSGDNIKSQIPIQPGSSASFTVYIYGTGDFIGAPECQVGDTNSVSSLQLGSNSTDGPSSLPSRLGALSEKLRSSTKRSEHGLSNKSSGPKSISSQNSSFRTTKSSTSCNKVYEAVLMIKYAGGPGMEGGYFRTCGLALNIEVIPAMFITKHDILPGEASSQFYLVLDVCNVTQHEMELHYAKTKQILVEKSETCRIPIPVDICPVVQVEKGGEEAACCEHIINNVDLRWILPDCSGKATLHGIRLTPRMVQSVSVSPIEWEITINGEMAKMEEMHFEAGEMINVDVCLRNLMRDELEDVRVSLDCFQDYQNGKCNYRLDSRFAVVGNDSVFVSQIGSGSSFQHSLALIFFVSGLYKVEFKCTQKEDSLIPVWKFNPPLDFQIN